MAEVKEELKPCPFCGCHDRRVGVRKMGTKGYKIICGKCGSAGPYVKIGDFANKMDAQEKAKETWNRRVNDDPDKVVKQLEKLKSLVPVNRVLDDIVNDKPKELGMLIAYEKAIEIVKGGGVDGN
jgi:Lar family restriction alleviation protein